MKTRLHLHKVPPSINKLWRRAKGGGMYKIERAKVWANSVGHSLNRQMEGQPRWNGPVMVTVSMKRPRANADLDNRLKCLGDLLEEYKVIANDKDIMAWNARWSNDLPQGVEVEVSITAADPVAA